MEEAGSVRVREQARECEALAVCRVAWFEAISALARRSREVPQDEGLLLQARGSFEADWPRYLKLGVTQDLVALAGDYADSFALRAYDSVQLAAVQTLHREVPGEVVFACFDARLAKAARVLGIGVA